MLEFLSYVYMLLQCGSISRSISHHPSIYPSYTYTYICRFIVPHFRSIQFRLTYITVNYLLRLNQRNLLLSIVFRKCAELPTPLPIKLQNMRVEFPKQMKQNSISFVNGSFFRSRSINTYQSVGRCVIVNRVMPACFAASSTIKEKKNVQCKFGNFPSFQVTINAFTYKWSSPHRSILPTYIHPAKRIAACTEENRNVCYDSVSKHSSNGGTYL